MTRAKTTKAKPAEGRDGTLLMPNLAGGVDEVPCRSMLFVENKVQAERVRIMVQPPPESPCDECNGLGLDGVPVYRGGEAFGDYSCEACDVADVDPPCDDLDTIKKQRDAAERLCVQMRAALRDAEYPHEWHDFTCERPDADELIDEIQGRIGKPNAAGE